MSKPKTKTEASVLEKLVELLNTPSNQYRSHGITLAQVGAAELVLHHAKAPGEREHVEVAIAFLRGVVNGDSQSDVTSRVKAAKSLLDGGFV